MLLQLSVGGRGRRAHPTARRRRRQSSVPARDSSQRGTAGELLHVEGAVDLQLQGGGDGLHADHTTEAREGVPEVGVHLAVLYELLLTLQGHLTDPTGPCVQAFTVGHLETRGGQDSKTTLTKNLY